MIVYLRTGRWPTLAELHTPYTWKDRVTGKDESYIAGFSTKEAARSYAARNRWTVVE